MVYGFMPGCALSSSSPENVKHVIQYLKNLMPDLVPIQTCCGKPTWYLGQEELFQQRFSVLTKMVQDNQIDELIVACQGCLQVMRQQNQFKSKSLWLVMAEQGLPDKYLGKGQNSDAVFSIQDSCPTKEMTEIHQAIRKILTQLGYQVEPNQLSGKNTLCCGMGGMCGVSNPKLAQKQAIKRVQDFNTPQIVTYCATCTSAMLLGGGQAWHLLDLIFGEVVYAEDIAPKSPLVNPVISWSNRYRTKKIIEKNQN